MVEKVGEGISGTSLSEEEKEPPDRSTGQGFLLGKVLELACLVS